MTFEFEMVENGILDIIVTFYLNCAGIVEIFLLNASGIKVDWEFVICDFYFPFLVQLFVNGSDIIITQNYIRVFIWLKLQSRAVITWKWYYHEINDFLYWLYNIRRPEADVIVIEIWFIGNVNGLRKAPVRFRSSFLA